jgi:hypothetical protein
MIWKKSLLPFCAGTQMTAPESVASTSVEALAPEDIGVEFYATFFLLAQGKLKSVVEILAELENDAD